MGKNKNEKCTFHSHNNMIKYFHFRWHPNWLNLFAGTANFPSPFVSSSLTILFGLKSLDFLRLRIKTIKLLQMRKR